MLTLQAGPCALNEAAHKCRATWRWALLTSVLFLIGGCAYGPPTLRVASPDLSSELSFPESSLEQIQANAVNGAALYPQVIVRTHPEKKVVACVRAYHEQDELSVDILGLALIDADGQVIDGDLVIASERAYQTNPDGLLYFTVICKKAYEWSQLEVGSITMGFGASINGSEVKQYSFDLEVDYVRYSGW